MTIAVSVATNAPVSAETNTVSVSGGGGLNTAGDTASDTVSIAPMPYLAVTMSDSGGFCQGGSGSFAVTVTNTGFAATSGTVTLTDTLPAGLVPTVADSGGVNGWALSTSGQTVTASAQRRAGGRHRLSGLDHRRERNHQRGDDPDQHGHCLRRRRNLHGQRHGQ